MKRAIIWLAVGLGLVLAFSSNSPTWSLYGQSLEPRLRPLSISPRGIVEYDVIIASDPNTLEARVTNKLTGSDAWVPVGGVSVDGKNRFYQAMVLVRE